MKYFNYKIARDFGFAPNPFGQYCTLATCKPKIRKAAIIGDWIIGTGTKELGCEHEIIYIMQVSEKLTFQEYWNDARFIYKKPVMNGSLVKTFGDNIYHKNEDGEWLQEDSHHSYSDGVLNKLNLDRDTRSNHVLISDNFYYFGKSSLSLPGNYAFIQRTGFKYLDISDGERIVCFVTSNFNPGLIDDPIQFSEFIRYNGK